MNLSLYQKLALILTLLFLFIAGVFYYGGKHLEQKTRFESQQRLHLSLAPSLVRDNPELQQGLYDYSALKNLFHTLMVLGPSFEFYLLDPEGNILTYSADRSLVKRDKISLQPIKNLIQYRHPLPVYGDDPKYLEQQNIFSATPIFNGPNLVGYLYVIVAGSRFVDTFDEVHQSNNVEVSLVILGVGSIMLFILLLWLFGNITSPVRRLNHEMKKVKEQGFNQAHTDLTQWSQTSKNEVHQLGNMFVEMMDHIQQQFMQLTQIDKQRKEMLAELSHDLRTPLSSLHGYLETLSVKGDDIPPESRKAFIDTALKSACQLKLLIDQIFELAHLESGHVSVQKEQFNLAELLYDIVEKFRLTAEKKQLILNFEPDNHDIIVSSDINKLERVLSNLFENAIRHTPEQGAITLKVSLSEAQGVIVEIRDTGVGIEQSELDSIFLPRYQAANTVRHRQQKNIGLGLAISQKLLTLLDSELNVESQLGKGTRFYFTLSEIT